jgi:hypothetical protein
MLVIPKQALDPQDHKMVQRSMMVSDGHCEDGKTTSILWTNLYFIQKGFTLPNVLKMCMQPKDVLV